MDASGNRILVEVVNQEPNFVTHEKYVFNEGEAQFDIAVIKLAEDLPLDDREPTVTVNAICLPWFGYVTGEVVAAGWGRIDFWKTTIPDKLGKVRFRNPSDEGVVTMTKGGPAKVKLSE